MEEIDTRIFVTTEDGKKLEGEIIFTFEANGDDFVLYQIGDEVFAGKVDEENNLSEVEEDEWKLVEKVYQEWLEEAGDEEDE